MRKLYTFIIYIRVREGIRKPGRRGLGPRRHAQYAAGSAPAAVARLGGGSTASRGRGGVHRHPHRALQVSLQRGRGQSVSAKQLAVLSGYRSYSTFSLAFKQRVGLSVTEWMNTVHKEYTKRTVPLCSF